MHDSIGYLMNDAARLFRRVFDAHTRDLGITGLQWRVLVWLEREPALRQSMLADILEVEPITLSRMLDRLSESGLVERRSDPDDRRAWQLFLTDKAMPLIDEMRKRAEIVNAEAAEGLSDSEHDQLSRLLEKVRCNLSRKELGNA